MNEHSDESTPDVTTEADDGLQSAMERLQAPVVAGEPTGLGPEHDRALNDLLGFAVLSAPDQRPSDILERRIFNEIGNRPAFETHREAPSVSIARFVAAAAIVVAVGLGGLSGWLYSSLQQESSVVADLHDSQERLSEQLNELQERFNFVTTARVEMCPLKPHGDAPDQPTASGRLFLDQDAGKWVLLANNLEPCKLGRWYRVWFVSQNGTVQGGEFQIKDGQAKIEIAAEDLPADTKSILITLEHPDEDPTKPTGPTILSGARVQSI